jgi:hypothetical protein
MGSEQSHHRGSAVGINDLEPVQYNKDDLKVRSFLTFRNTKTKSLQLHMHDWPHNDPNSFPKSKTPSSSLEAAQVNMFHYQRNFWRRQRYHIAHIRTLENTRRLLRW